MTGMELLNAVASRTIELIEGDWEKIRYSNFLLSERSPGMVEGLMTTVLYPLSPLIMGYGAFSLSNSSEAEKLHYAEKIEGIILAYKVEDRIKKMQERLSREWKKQDQDPNFFPAYCARVTLTREPMAFIVLGRDGNTGEFQTVLFQRPDIPTEVVMEQFRRRIQHRVSLN